MKKFSVLFVVLLTSLSVGIFAVGSVNANIGLITTDSTPTYTIGVTVKSIGAVGFELTVEGNLGNSFDLSQVENIKQWDLMPLIYFSLPSGEIRPYAGVGVLTTYNVSDGNFDPISLNTLYYKGGVDVFISGFSMFAEAKGSFTYQPKFQVGMIKEWIFGVGLAF